MIFDRNLIGYLLTLDRKFTSQNLFLVQQKFRNVKNIIWSFCYPNMKVLDKSDF